MMVNGHEIVLLLRIDYASTNHRMQFSIVMRTAVFVAQWFSGIWGRWQSRERGNGLASEANGKGTRDSEPDVFITII